MEGKTSKTPIRLGKDPLIEKGRRKNREARKEPKVPESAF